MIDDVEHIPAGEERLEFGLFLLLYFLLLWLAIYVDDLSLRRGLLLNHTFHDNDIVVGVAHSHLGRAGWHWCIPDWHGCITGWHW